ncbi:MAG: HAMP domain-containing protein [Deltaproteobacteria bacterium]|nr:HAMP domain-containing protein [Deltaproteobacteria bacterium]
MSSKRPTDLRHTLAFRLTLWYAAIFTLSSILAFFFFYFLVTTVMEEQTDRELLNQVGKFSTLLRTEGLEAVKSVAVAESRAGGVKKTFFRLLYRDGRVFSSTNMSYWQALGVNLNAIEEILKGTPHFYETISIPDRREKVRVLYSVIGRGMVLQIGQAMELQSQFIEAFKRIFIITMSILLLASAAIGWFMARRALSGVEAVTSTARRISKDDLETRVPVNRRGDEIAQLATTFNQMLDRIEKLVTGMKEMSDNIAHDLRSPITRIRGIAEVTMTTGTSLEDYESMAASIIEECDRLLDMINTMLVISEVEAGVETTSVEDLDLCRLVEDACELLQPIAEDKNVILRTDISGSCPYRGDIRKLQRMIANLIDNAIKYTATGGSVTAAVTCAGGSATIRISDTGIGIPSDDLPHIFERFYRGDRSRSERGIGLGLSLARAVARSHGGDITVTSRPGEGSTFIVTLR